MTGKVVPLRKPASDAKRAAGRTERRTRAEVGVGPKDKRSREVAAERWSSVAKRTTGRDRPSLPEYLVARSRVDRAVGELLGPIVAEGIVLLRRAVRPSAVFRGDRDYSLDAINQWWMERLVPAWNQACGKYVRMCRECGEKFAPHDRRDEYCGDACSGRARNRGRQRVGNGRSSFENARRKSEARLQKHWGSCSLCKAGRPCGTREAMLAGDDALSRRRSTLSTEDAEHAQARRIRRGTRRVP